MAAVTPRLTELLKEHSELNGHTRPAHRDFILIFNDHAILSAEIINIILQGTAAREPSRHHGIMIFVKLNRINAQHPSSSFLLLADETF